jgi:hypothetical protein
MDETIKLIIAAVLGVLGGVNTKILFNWFSRHGNGHTSPCEFLRELKERFVVYERNQIEILQRLTRIETKIDNGVH